MLVPASNEVDAMHSTLRDHNVNYIRTFFPFPLVHSEIVLTGFTRVKVFRYVLINPMKILLKILQ